MAMLPAGNTYCAEGLSVLTAMSPHRAASASAPLLLALLGETISVSTLVSSASRFSMSSTVTMPTSFPRLPTTGIRLTP